MIEDFYLQIYYSQTRTYKRSTLVYADKKLKLNQNQIEKLNTDKKR